MYYKLDENKSVIPSSLEEWSNLTEGTLPANFKHVGNEIVNGNRISTVFIGMCFDFMNNGIPLVFETMIFDENGSSCYQDRYSTWKEAEEGHQYAIELVKHKNLAINK
jgi:hypothetical protein